MANQRTFGFNRVLATGAPLANSGVAVYNQGTLNLSSIFSDTIGTVKANPFVTDANGYWFFYSANGRYDVSLSTVAGAFVPGAATNYTLGDVEVASFVSLNGLTGDTQLFATGTAGTDFNIASAVATHTFNIPDASAVNRGLITTGAQTIAGAKTFSTPIAIGSGGTGITTAPASGQLLIGNAGAWAVAGLTGTANQITVTTGAGSITLSGPQNIHTGASPTFVGLTLSGLTAQSFLYSGAAGVLATTAAPAAGNFLVSPGGGSAPILGTIAGTGGTTATYAAGTWTINSPAGTGISSLNGLGASSQTFAPGTAGSDFNISSLGSVHTFNIPDAGLTVRGLVTTSAQTLSGLKTFPGGIQTQGVYTTLATVGSVGTGETILAQFTLPAGSLSTTGTMCKIIAWGHSTNNANTKTLRAYFGATQLLGGTGIAVTVNEAGSWIIGAEVYGAGAATQRSIAQLSSGPAGGSITTTGGAVTQPAETASGTILLKVTGTGTTNNDLTLEAMIVSLCI